MGICVGPVVIDDPVILAPMSGVTDRPFREVVRGQGAGLVVSEMIASQEMVRAARRSMRTSTDCAEEHPMAVQLAGHDPEIMAEAASFALVGPVFVGGGVATGAAAARSPPPPPPPQATSRLVTRIRSTARMTATLPSAPGEWPAEFPAALA